MSASTGYYRAEAVPRKHRPGHTCTYYMLVCEPVHVTLHSDNMDRLRE